MTSKRTHVFISYAKEDSKKAENLNAELKKHDVITWIDYERLNVGERWERSINKAISDSRAFIFLCSVNSVNKTGFVQRELKKAIDKIKEYPVDKAVLMVIRLDNTEPLDEELHEFQWLDWFDDNPPIEKLINSLRLNQVQELINQEQLEKQQDIQAVSSGKTYKPAPNTIGKLFDNPDDLDIYCDRERGIVYIFHGPVISHYSIDYLEYHRQEHWVAVVLSNGQRLDLGVKIQWLIRPYWEEVNNLFIIRTKDGETIDGIEVNKINIGKPTKTVGVQRNVSSDRSKVGFKILKDWIHNKLNR